MDRLKVIFLTGVLLLFYNSSACAQGFSTISGQFKNYRESSITEKIFVHTDRSAYVAGEIAWFKLYTVDGTFHQASDLSKVAYVELLDKENLPLLQTKLELRAGAGQGSFFIPLSVKTGSYKLRAYTNWMKNGAPEYFYERILDVVNTIETPGLNSEAQAGSYDIQFFPEGGNLVEGLPAKLAFRAVDESGEGLDFSGILVNQFNETILNFKPLKFGIGNFVFTPKPGESYKALITSSNQQKVIDLPAGSKKGYVMSLRDEGSAVKVDVYSNLSSEEQIYLFVHGRQLILRTDSALMQQGRTSFLISKSQLAEGISHLTVFNKDRVPVAERLFFRRPLKNLVLEARTDVKDYTLRKKVNLEISSKDERTQPVVSDISVAVYRIDSLEREADDILSYIWLKSDLKGAVQSPAYYFQTLNKESDQAADNLMLTHGWRRFKWTDLLQGKNFSYKFQPEYAAHIISGKVNTSENLPARDVFAYFSMPGRNAQISAARSDASGKLNFFTNYFYGNTEIIIQADPKSQGSLSFELENFYSDTYSSGRTYPLRLSPGQRPSLLSRSVGMQTQNIFNKDKLNRFTKPLTDSGSFYGNNFKRYKLDDYTRFTTMEEVLREYVPEISVNIQQKDYRIKIWNAVDRTFYEAGSLILIDGVPVFDHQKLMEYDPKLIQSLEVVPERYYYGGMAFNGLAYFKTYKGNIPQFVFDQGVSILEYEGLQLEREFFSPLYESRAEELKRIPDFRSLLFWEPGLKSDSSGKSSLSFYTSDIEGKYKVVLQGAGKDGRFGSSSYIFNVTK